MRFEVGSDKTRSNLRPSLLSNLTLTLERCHNGQIEEEVLDYVGIVIHCASVWSKPVSGNTSCSKVNSVVCKPQSEH